MKLPLQALAVGYVFLMLYEQHYNLLIKSVIAFFVGAIVISFWRSVK